MKWILLFLLLSGSLHAELSLSKRIALFSIGPLSAAIMGYLILKYA